jgi:hypothetical protein
VRLVAIVILSALMLFSFSGCTTAAANKAMAKPNANEDSSYTGFNREAGEKSKRKAEKLEAVKDDTDPETAVTELVRRLQKEPSIAIPAEEQLKLWGSKQGTDRIVVSKVRDLLKSPKMEARAPALRLTILYGGPDSHGDLIECLADSEYSIRETAFKALRARTRKDFGYAPQGGEVARANAVDQWRQWWQGEQRRVAVQAPSVYETNPPSEPRTTKQPSEKDKRADADR